MIRKLVTLSLPVAALVGGAFAGDMLRGPADTSADPAAPDHAAADHAAVDPVADDHAEPKPPVAADDHGGDASAAFGEEGFFTFPSQFFVPLVRQGDMRDMMILTLTLQTNAASIDALGRKEHALRDALLRALMIHANTGGFDGNYTADRNLVLLRKSLMTATKTVTKLPVSAVLIEDIALQPG
ncbi:hypothetical protein PANO111632_10625 [Paracoccus nototheniae]|uniref:Flagellar protein FliL n=1 Tax=Paracoccus nototheniae TaxID=2489002 RepID=A0ABW4DTC8_9RHOB|nr:hypothetical protein [Paracoccus nototheniae]